MSKKRFSFVALSVVAALVAAGVAIAATKTTSATATSVTATFSATSASKTHTTTCTAKSGDTFQSTTATYKGTSTSSDARLNGPITLRAHSFVDTTSGLGTVSGVYTIKGAGKSGSVGVIDGVVSGGSLSGILTGAALHPGGKLIATLGGTFDQTNGFAADTLGTGTTGGGAVVSNGFCPKKTTKK